MRVFLFFVMFLTATALRAVDDFSIVTYDGRSYVLITNLKTDEQRQVEVGVTPNRHVIIHPNQKTAYITHESEHFITEINIEKAEVIRKIPIVQGYALDVTFSPDGGIAYATDHFSSSPSISVIDVPNGRVTKTIDIDGQEPRAITISPDGKTLYVANYSSSNISIIDLEEKTEKKVTVGRFPNSLSLTHDGKILYVGDEDTSPDARISVVDVALAEVKTTISLGTDIREVAVAPNGTDLYVSSGDSHVAIVNIASNEVTKTLNVSFPMSIGIYS